MEQENEQVGTLHGEQPETPIEVTAQIIKCVKCGGINVHYKDGCLDCKEQEEITYDEKTVDIKKGKQIRKVRVREIPIMWEGKQEIVEVMKMSFGERALYSEKFVNIQIKGEFNDVTVSLAQMQIQAIIMGVHKAPFPINEDYVTHELDGEIGELIHKQVEIFNKLSPDQKKKSDGQSNTNQITSK